MLKKRKLSLTVIAVVLLMLMFTSACFAETGAKETAKTGIIRAISDKADDSEEMSYVEFERAAAENCAAITRYMISH